MINRFIVFFLICCSIVGWTWFWFDEIAPSSKAFPASDLERLFRCEYPSSVPSSKPADFFSWEWRSPHSLLVQFSTSQCVDCSVNATLRRAKDDFVVPCCCSGLSATEMSCLCAPIFAVASNGHFLFSASVDFVGCQGLGACDPECTRLHVTRLFHDKPVPAVGSQANVSIATPALCSNYMLDQGVPARTGAPLLLTGFWFRRSFLCGDRRHSHRRGPSSNISFLESDSLDVERVCGDPWLAFDAPWFFKPILRLPPTTPPPPTPPRPIYSSILHHLRVLGRRKSNKSNANITFILLVGDSIDGQLVRWLGSLMADAPLSIREQTRFACWSGQGLELVTQRRRTNGSRTTSHRCATNNAREARFLSYVSRDPDPAARAQCPRKVCAPDTQAVWFRQLGVLIAHARFQNKPAELPLARGLAPKLRLLRQWADLPLSAQPSVVQFNYALHHAHRSTETFLAYRDILRNLLGELRALFPSSALIWRRATATYFSDSLPEAWKCRSPQRMRLLNTMADQVVANGVDAVLDAEAVTLGRHDASTDNRHYVNSNVYATIMNMLFFLSILL